jgi:3-dehydroquinate dehydratase I
MIARKPVKVGHGSCRIVGVITNRSELRTATRMQHPPDLFELRLDHLVGLENELEKAISRLQAPLIITARHPAEGGANNLSLARRGRLLSRFLPQARYVDLELRSMKALPALLNLSRHKNVRRIISFHDFKSTPHPRSLHAKRRAAKLQGADFFKVATRTDTPVQLARLLNFLSTKDAALPVSALGVGKLGGIARIALARSGSVLAYASIGKPQVEGQLSVGQLRAAFHIFELC